MDAGREVVPISRGEGWSLSSAEPTPAPSLPLLPGGQRRLLLHSQELLQCKRYSALWEWVWGGARPGQLEPHVQSAAGAELCKGPTRPAS